MSADPVISYFTLYILYVLTPLIPAVVIFKLFPKTEVAVEGPLKGLTLNATGAFGGYVVTVILGFFLVRGAAAYINSLRTYPVEAQIQLEPGETLAPGSFYYRETPHTTQVLGTNVNSSEFDFVFLLNRPDEKGEFWLDVWSAPSQGTQGFGSSSAQPLRQRIPLKISMSGSSPHRYLLQTKGSSLVFSEQD
jgi:hypothetical protein